jgi:hypothetical protein
LILTSACVAAIGQRAALFGIAGAAMLLPLVGIHNAWDGAAYHVFVKGVPPRGGR